MKFSELGLSEKVLKAVEASGYDTPTPIQEQAIPFALQGRDMLGIAQTGTGKTAAFTLPMLSTLERGRARARMPRTLILEPTRELAAQVEEAFGKYGVNHKLNLALLIGGVSFGDQEAKIARGADVVIATPGRLLDFTERGGLLLNAIEILVIDEADRMLDMGFIPDIERICKLVPFTRQTLFFSATMPPEITRLADAFLHNPVRVEVSRAATTAREHHPDARALGRNAGREALDAEAHHPRRRELQERAHLLQSQARRAGGLPLAAEAWLLGRLRCMATSTSACAWRRSTRSGPARSSYWSAPTSPPAGLDIPDVSHVINYDAPHHSEDYVHRIGRTGRAGKSGQALTLVSRIDQKAIAEIEKLIARKIDWQDGAQLPPDDEAEAPRARAAAGGRGGAHRRSERPAPVEAAERPDRHASGAPRLSSGPSAPTGTRAADPDSRRHHAERPPRERLAAEAERAAAPRAPSFADPPPRRERPAPRGRRAGDRPRRPRARLPAATGQGPRPARARADRSRGVIGIRAPLKRG